MVKTTIKEITEKFDKNGTLIERLTREEFIEDDEAGLKYISTNPNLTTEHITTQVLDFKPIDSINDISTAKEAIKYSDKSTENAFKQAVSKCINTK